MSTTATEPAIAGPGGPSLDTRRIDRFLQLMLERGASDLHLSVGRPPMFRLSGEMDAIRYRTLSQVDFDGLIRPITPAALWADFEENGDVDYAYQLGEDSRFRVNLFEQERGSGAVFRVIPTEILSVEQLGLPQQVGRFARLESGLVLVTGPTGSGKSTTLAAIIDLINRTRKLHVITIEDPIEFVHPNKECVVHQREVGAHARSFADALRVANREDPDILLVGEMRDLETIQMALEAAEKGMLVFGTLHTNSAAKTIDRIVNVFPSGEQESIRQVLGETTRGILAQQLLPKVGGGRVAALEILFGSPQATNLIREGKISQLSSLIQTGVKRGMTTMDQSLIRLFEEGTITAEAALDKAIDKVDVAEKVGLAKPESTGG
ncbi:MAG: type IV pilus twitching motility protein PilT [Acidobacteriota bacterium]